MRQDNARRTLGIECTGRDHRMRRIGKKLLNFSGFSIEMQIRPLHQMIFNMFLHSSLQKRLVTDTGTGVCRPEKNRRKGKEKEKRT